jgi:hypothetical protein
MQPSLTLYYYKDEEHQDPTVKVCAMLKMNEELGTPDPLKQAVAIPDAEAHVIGSHLVSKDIEGVEKTINEFAEKTLNMKPIK